MSDVQNAGQDAPAKKKVVVSEIAALIDAGVSRTDIAKQYGVPFTEMKAQVFDLPELRNRKAKKVYNSLEVVNDLATQEAVEVIPAEQTEEVAESTTEDYSQGDAGDQQEQQVSSSKPQGWSRTQNV